MSTLRSVASRLANIPRQTVWSEMTPLAAECGAINLGQGFPNFAPPRFVAEHLQKVADIDTEPGLNHQYCRPLGHLALVSELRKYYTNLLQRPIGDAEIVVTSGVTQGLNIVFQALIDQGDEVITFLPAFDLYANDIEMAGGVVKFVAMKPQGTTADEWAVSEADIRAQITPKTKAILFNTPQNVPGKVWSIQELEMIARVAREHNLYVVSDEVYGRLVYDGKEHMSIAALPGMFERSFVLCSSGKTFASTGYKIGWIVASKELIVACNQVQAHQTFSIATPLQIAVGRSMATASEPGNTYYSDIIHQYSHRRELLCNILRESGLPTVFPSGGYFVLADISVIDEKHYVDPKEQTVGLDWQFCRWLTRTIGVNAIPVSAFCTKDTRHLYERYARFAFCKKEEDIIEAGKRLKKLADYMKK